MQHDACGAATLRSGATISIRNCETEVLTVPIVNSTVTMMHCVYICVVCVLCLRIIVGHCNKHLVC